MAEESGELTVAQRLASLLDRGLLPAGGPAEAAERLLERLERPARIALLGLPGSGKSAILNLLAGTIVVPETLRLPTIVAQHGTEPRMICTLTDGRTKVLPGTDLADVLTLAPALVTIEMDLPALKVISLLEVSAGPMEAEQRRAAAWASKRADIIIWCTTSYLPKEQIVWESMPDVVKDNGFLFLTKVDLLGSREAADGMLERVEQRAGEDFRQVLAISAKQARAAMPPGGAVDREMFRSSGAAAVITTIKSRVQAARRADTDMAELLLARHVEASSIVAKRFAETEADEGVPASRSTEWTPPPADEPKVAEEVAVEQVSAADIDSATVSATETPAPARTEPLAPPPGAVDQPEPVAEFDPSVLAMIETIRDAPEQTQQAAMAAPEPEAASEPRPLSEPAIAPTAEAGPVAAGAIRRFSERIRQAPAGEEHTAAPVPLKTTWKSRAEMAAESAARQRPMASAVTARPPEAPTESIVPAGQQENAGSDGTQRPAAAKPVLETGRPRPGFSARPAAQGSAPPVFGARRPAAETEIDLSALRNRPAATPEPQPVEERPTQPVPPPPIAAETIPRQPAGAGTRVPVASAAPPATSETASPRVAVLRDRRPEPAPAEPAVRRERPRVALRTVPAAAPAPVRVAASERAILDQAIDLVVSRAAALGRLIDPADRPPVDLVLDHARETVEKVQDILSQGQSDAMRRISADHGEVLDLIMLMQLEKGHAPADDALTLILQLRRDMETLRAA